MSNRNPFEHAAIEMACQAKARWKPTVREVESIDGFDAKPLSFFVIPFRSMLLELIRSGEADFVVCADKIYLLRSTVEPYLPGGVDWDDLG
jgi:hypothetical protein